MMREAQYSILRTEEHDPITALPSNGLLSLAKDKPSDGGGNILEHDEEGNNAGLSSQPSSLSSAAFIGNESKVPLTKRPSKARDSVYAILFVIHLVLVSLLSLLEEEHINNIFYGGIKDSSAHSGKDSSSSISNNNSSKWTTIFLIVTVLSCFLGGGLVFLLSNEDIRVSCLSRGIFLSITFEVCLGNIILLTKSRFSLLGVVVLVIAYIDSYSYKGAKENVSFTSALITLVIRILQPFGITLTIACGAILAGQTITLLWWALLFEGLLSDAAEIGYTEFLLVLMCLSLYWTTQFYHYLMAYVVGGCVLWHYVGDGAGQSSSSISAAVAANGIISGATGLGGGAEQTSDAAWGSASARVVLHSQCAVSTGLGSVAKGALLGPAADAVGRLDVWLNGVPSGAAAGPGMEAHAHTGGGSGVGSTSAVLMTLPPPTSPSLAARCCSTLLRGCVCIRLLLGLESDGGSRNRVGNSSLCGLRACVRSLAPFHRRHHRLAVALAATYGRTYCRSAEAADSSALAIAAEDTTAFTLAAAAKELAGFVAVAIGVLAERKDDASWPVFFLVNYALSYCSVSLALHVYSAAVDALMVAFSERPQKLMHENQIVFLRFLRRAEHEV